MLREKVAEGDLSLELIQCYRNMRAEVRRAARHSFNF